MKARAIDAAVAAANPVPHGALSSAALDDAGAHMLAAICAEPVAAAEGHGSQSRRGRPAGSRRKTHRMRWLTSSTALAALVAVIAFALAGGDGTDSATPAFGAALIRYADNTPLVMLQLPGWHTVDAIEDSAEEGELHYLPDGAPSSDYAAQAELHWRTGTLSGWVKDRAGTSSSSSVATVLGDEAHVFRYMGGNAAASTFTALWLHHGRVLEYRASVHDLAAFERMLGAIHEVDEATWLGALPASVITAAEHPATISAMLEGVPLPPGFQSSQIDEGGLAQDRYQVGASVAGTVACEWIKRWMEGRQGGNAGEVREAVAAMATSSHWPVLRSMASQGAYPEVLGQYASQMTAGTWHGYPLGAAADSGLGCSSRGVTLPLNAAERQLGPQRVRSSSG